MLAMLSNEDFHYAFNLVQVIFEPNRILTSFFEDAAEGHLHNHRPRMCDLATGSTSILTAMQQYLSGLAAGLPPMSRVLWQHAGASSFRYWMAQTEELVTARKVLLYIAAGMVRRHGHFQEPPWSLTRLADSRLNPQIRSKVVETITETDGCCLKHGITRDLKNQGYDFKDGQAEASMIAASP